MKPDEERFVAKIQKSKSVSMLIRVIRIRDRVYVDFRDWVESKRYTGFGYRGYNFPLEILKQVKEALDEI